MPKFDPRKLMELAINVMQQSVGEVRPDGKASPSVGAVLWKPDGAVETASRGELRDGDHAEYTLLERKNRHCKLDGSALFATLEPCAPGSRRHPKLSELESDVLEALSKAERRGWEWLATKQTVTSSEYAAAMRIPNRTALHHLKRFSELGLLRKLGSGPATRYVVTKP